MGVKDLDGWKKEVIVKLFNLAVDLQPVGKTRIIAAVLKNRKIIGIGQNSYNSTYLARRFKKNEKALYEHAEIAAMKIGIRSGSIFDKIFISRARFVNNVWVFGNAKPCNGCMEALKLFNVKEVYYSE